jgi:uncharacterized protein YfaS (alpha-2-macroglobulin family)
LQKYRFTWFIGLILLTTFAALALQRGFAPNGQKGATVRMMPNSMETPAGDRADYQIILQDAGAPVLLESADIAAAEPLAEADAQALLEQLPPLPAEEIAEEPVLPTQSKPAPRPGPRIEVPFPVMKIDDPVPAAEQVVPQVVRVSPEGEDILAPFLSVTFNTPMVPISSHGTLAEEEVPVQLTPEVPGTWRWAGTQTLIFEPEGGFPQSTAFQAEVNADFRSISGLALGQSYSWRFETPRLKPVRFFPTHRPQVLRPPMAIAFNQPVNPDEISGKLLLRANGKRFTIRLLTQEEALKVPEISQQFRHFPDTHWFAFRPMFLLPAGTGVTLTVPVDMRALEGPLPSRSEHVYEFSTYGKLDIDRINCYGQQGCGPANSWQVYFTNPLDEDKFTESWIEIEPAIPFDWSISGQTLVIEPESEPNTNYRITFAAEILDRFGQTLETPRTRTVEVGPVPETFMMNANHFAFLDPRTDPALHFLTAGYDAIDLKFYRVGVKDWDDFLKVRRALNRNTNVTWPGELIREERLDLKESDGDLTKLMQDLAPLFADGDMVLVDAEPKGGDSAMQKRLGRAPQLRRNAWLQHTQIGVHVAADNAGIRIFVHQLQDGAPIAGAKVQLVKLSDGTQLMGGESDASGLVQFAKPPEGTGTLAVVAQHGSQKVFLPDNTYGINSVSNWRARPQEPRLAAHVIDDRGIYKPGETVNLKGWLREIGMGSPVLYLKPQSPDFVLSVISSRGNEIFKKEITPDQQGAFDVSFELPKDINLGNAYAQLLRNDDRGRRAPFLNHSFQVAEFRTPEFEVEVTLPSGNLVTGETLEAQLQATLYSGEPLSEAAIDWNVTTAEASYKPPNWHHFQFGKYLPWWCRPWFPQPMPTARANFKGITNPAGTAFLDIDFDGDAGEFPLQLRVEGVAQDTNRNTIAASQTAILHPSELYVGLKASHNFAAAGEELAYDVVVTDIDGQIVPNAQVLFEVIPFEHSQRKAETEVAPVFSTQIKLSDEPMQLSFELEEKGSYQVRARVRDGAARTMMTQMPLWIGDLPMPDSERVGRGNVILIPDRTSYDPGDTAQITLQAPFAEGFGMIQYGRHLAMKTFTVPLEDGQANLEIPIDIQAIPQLAVRATFFGNKDGKPAYAYGEVQLTVSIDRYLLDLAISTDQQQYMPGEEAEVQVSINGAGGSDASLTLFVVDEGVLALSNYQLRNPLETFIPLPYWQNSHASTHENLILERPKLEAALPVMEQAVVTDSMMRSRKTMAPMAAPMGGQDDTPLTVREDFRALAAYYASLPLDASGNATVRFKLPDRLTRYRVMAVAAGADGTKFGVAEANIQTSFPLTVRPNLPRFLNFGDQAQLSFTIHNHTAETRAIELAIRGQGLSFPAGQGRSLELPPFQRREVLIPAKASLAGEATVQAVLISDQFKDAVQIRLPIYQPATREAFATYGDTDSNKVHAQIIKIPTDAFDQFGGLDISTSATALHGLTDAVYYLRDYPYPFAEPLASRILGYLALRDVLPSFGSEWDPEKTAERMRNDLRTLSALQKPDGGFSIWRSAQESHPFISVHVAHALVVAKREGFQEAQQVLPALQRYLDRLPQIMQGLNYSKTNIFVVQAYDVMRRRAAGESVSNRAEQLLQSMPIDQVPLDALAMLLPSLPEQGYSKVWRQLRNHLEETASTASINDALGSGFRVFGSQRRTDALTLMGLLERSEQPDLCSKLARGLLAHRTAGQWRTVQENVFVILALGAYFQAFEKVEPQFTADYWLDQQQVATHQFTSRSVDRQATTLPMSWLSQQLAETSLTFVRQGTGRMYYRLGFQYAPRDLDLEAASHGFSVSRKYEAVDDPNDVTVDEGGVVRIKRGARVRVSLEMATHGIRHHVALVDRLPAGLEIINSNLPTSERLDDLSTKRRPFPWWQSYWYSHQNLRDDRAEAFGLRVRPGLHHYSYVARAVNAGTFIVPPAKAEEMYAPETFGRTATTRVRIED